MLQPVSRQSDLTLEPDQTPPRPADVSTFAPLGVPAFRMIWIANLFANLGVWAQSVAAAWVVTSSAGGALLVAMIQVAAALPLVLMSIVTGVIADNYDRRKVMLFGLTIDVRRLAAIRTERRPNSRYCSMDQCMQEIEQAEALYRRQNIPFIDTTRFSIEEISTRMMNETGLQRRFSPR